jgi:hypothetical protein
MIVGDEPLLSQGGVLSQGVPAVIIAHRHPVTQDWAPPPVVLRR